MFGPGTPGALAIDWPRRNLFGSVLNTLLTISCWRSPLLIVPPLFRWGVTQATLLGTTRADCTGDGACWTFIRVRLPLFFSGTIQRASCGASTLPAFCWSPSHPGAARAGSPPLAVACSCC